MTIPLRYRIKHDPDIDWSVQERRNSIANALEICLSCTNPPVYSPGSNRLWSNISSGIKMVENHFADISIGSGIGLATRLHTEPMMSQSHTICNVNSSKWVNGWNLSPRVPQYTLHLANDWYTKLAFLIPLTNDGYPWTSDKNVPIQFHSLSLSFFH